MEKLITNVQNSLRTPHWSGPFQPGIMVRHPDSIRDVLKTAGNILFILHNGGSVNRPSPHTMPVAKVAQWKTLKGTTRVKFSNSHNLWKPHDNNVCIGYRQPKLYIH